VDSIPISSAAPSERHKENTYRCPLYKTAERKGTLVTTGHSTNFILYIDTPLKSHSDSRRSVSSAIEDKDYKHWIKRGAAMLTQLSD